MTATSSRPIGGTDGSIQSRIAETAEALALGGLLNPMAVVMAVSVTPCRGDLAGRWFVEVDAETLTGLPRRLSGFADRHAVTLSTTSSDPFALTPIADRAR